MEILRALHHERKWRNRAGWTGWAVVVVEVGVGEHEVAGEVLLLASDAELP